MLSLIDAVEEGEVHDSLQIAVLVRQFTVLLPCCRIGRFGHPCLSNGVEVGIFPVECLHPKRHSVAVGIRICIHTDAVYADCLYPPLAVLNQILHHVRVALVEVGHCRHEPSVYCFTQVYLACIRIEHRCKLIAGLQILVVDLGIAVHGVQFLLMLGCLIFGREPFGSVKPVLRGHVGYPWMVESAMVENHVHNHLQTFAVSLVYKTLILVVGTETWVYTIVVGSGIAVIG